MLSSSQKGFALSKPFLFQHLTIEGKTEDDSFVKKYSIDNKYDFDSIDAKVVDGLLTLSLPYKAEVKPRKIKVT